MYGSLLTGDINSDCVVNASDYVICRNASGQVVGRGFGADVNADGVVDISDYQLWAGHFGNFNTGAGATTLTDAVPKPAAATQFLIGAADYFRCCVDMLAELASVAFHSNRAVARCATSCFMKSCQTSPVRTFSMANNNGPASTPSVSFCPCGGSRLKESTKP